MEKNGNYSKKVLMAEQKIKSKTDFMADLKGYKLKNNSPPQIPYETVILQIIFFKNKLNKWAGILILL